MQGQGGGAPKWSVTVHWVHWPWDFPGGAGQDQPPLVFCPGLPFLSHKEKVPTCAGLGDSQVKPSYENNLAAANSGPEAH